MAPAGALAYQEDATIDLMLSEAIKTNAIEGEDLDRESVRSSLLSLITSDTLPETSDQKAAGAASLLVDVRMNWQGPLSHELLGKWQSMAVPEQRYTSIVRGEYRNDPLPMQVVSGPYGREKVHYEAPPTARVPDEMAGLIDWYNQSSPLNGDQKIPGKTRANTGFSRLIYRRVGKVMSSSLQAHIGQGCPWSFPELSTRLQAVLATNGPA